MMDDYRLKLLIALLNVRKSQKDPTVLNSTILSEYLVKCEDYVQLEDELVMKINNSSVIIVNTKRALVITDDLEESRVVTL